tara:strand:- start:1221 stop:1910 length:690 start_codon:yes stop_codon:yes gene_type:complete
MAIRLLPFRDYDEHEVVNLFKSAGNLDDFIDLSSATKRSTKQGDAGVFVKVSSGNLNDGSSDWDPVDVTSNPTSLLGKTDYPHVGRNTYPQASLSVEPVGLASDPCLGVTLRQTVARDELGENLLYNPIKKDELYGVLPGEAVPVLSRGLISLTDDAIVDADVGDRLVPHLHGRASGVAGASVGASDNVVGTVIGKGYRNDGINNGTNVFGKAGLQVSGSYFIVKLDAA